MEGACSLGTAREVMLLLEAMPRAASVALVTLTKPVAVTTWQIRSHTELLCSAAE